MRTLTLQQGSAEWLAHRRTTRNASEAPAMMGVSPYVTRAELIRQRATGIERDVDENTQRIFDRGHAVEPALRALAEKIIGEDLYPVTGVSDDGYLGASFDGVTLGEDAIFEAKQSNAQKMEAMRAGAVPQTDLWQVVHQFAVCDSAERCLYMVGDGTEEGTVWMWIYREKIEDEIKMLRAGWQQFDADVAAYVPEPVRAEVVAAPVAGFGALSLRVEGRVLASNLDAFKADAEAFIARLPSPSELQSDQDFADAESAVKACEEAEGRIKSAREAALAQMADVDSLLRTAQSISETIRAARLALERAVKAEKENRRLQIVTTGRDAYAAHVEALKAETKGVWLPLPAPDFAGAIKGKRTLTSMKDAVDTTLAQAKIAASESAAHIRAALACLTEETAEHKHLFPDYLNFIAKPVDDIRALVRGRISEHKAAEEAKAEELREKIRKEEADKLAAEQRQREADAAKPAEPIAEPASPIRGRTGDWDSGRVPDGDRGEQPGFAGHAQGSSSPEHPTAAAPSTARIKLGDINARLAPLTITADGLASLGFHPVGKDGAAKLYGETDFMRICQALTDLIRQAAVASTGRKAA